VSRHVVRIHPACSAYVRRAAQGLHGNRLNGGECDLRTVVQFVRQNPEAVFLLLVLGEIYERGECSTKFPALSKDRRLS
jgi:hypothetical protein